MIGRFGSPPASSREAHHDAEPVHLQEVQQCNHQEMCPSQLRSHDGIGAYGSGGSVVRVHTPVDKERAG